MSTPASSEARAFVRQFLAACPAPASPKAVMAAMIGYRGVTRTKPGSAERLRIEPRLDAAMGRIGMRRTKPMPDGWERAIAFHGWCAMSPHDPAYRAEDFPPDPQFEDAVGAQLMVGGIMANGGALVASPGPIVVGPHALSRLFDRRGARTIDEGRAALEALYATLRSMCELLPARWALERIAQRDPSAIIPGPRGGAWIATPLLINTVGIGEVLTLPVRTFLDADLLNDAQSAALAEAEGAVLPPGANLMTAGQHFFNPLQPVRTQIVLADIYADELAEMGAAEDGVAH